MLSTSRDPDHIGVSRQSAAPTLADHASGVPMRLVIVPCGCSKIWDRDPKRGPVAAAEAYTGTPFRLNRQYAECFGDAWVVLSAKYGFIAPEFSIPEPRQRAAQ